MKKKILGFGVVFVMLFSFMGCCQIDNSLARCKTAAQDEIQSYVEAKQETEYSFENWEALLLAAESGKAAVAAAKTESETTEAAEDAKRTIDSILPMPETGLDKELEDKIIQAYLDTKVKPLFEGSTLKDVRLERFLGTFIYFNDEYSITKDKADGTLAAVQLINRFEQSSAEDRIYVWIEEAILTMDEAAEQNRIFDFLAITTLCTADLDVNTFMNMKELAGEAFLYRYFGTYNGAVALMFTPMGQSVLTEETVAGITFKYPSTYKIRIFKDTAFYGMTEAYDLGFLTDDDVAAIHHIYKHGRPLGS